MSAPPRKLGTVRLPTPANDNIGPTKPLRMEVRIPQSLAVQRVEVEVFASLVDDLVALVANDNKEPSK